MSQLVNTYPEFTEIIQNQDKVICAFVAAWVGPCRLIAPLYEELGNSYPTIQFIKVDVDVNGEAAAAADINIMPTFKMYVKGNVVGEVVGPDKIKLKALIALNA